MAGGVNLFTSRRRNHRRCLWWARDDSIRDLSKLVREKAPEGSFWAREISSDSRSKQGINQSFLFDAESVTITTDDRVEGLKPDCIVMYDGQPYRVLDVQTRKHAKEGQFMRAEDVTTYLRLKR